MMRRHAYGWICDRCGARLDPGESCDCRSEREVTAVDGGTKARSSVGMEQLKRCHVGEKDIRAMRQQVADMRLLAAATEAPDTLVRQLEKQLGERKRQHTQDMAAVIGGINLIRDELTRQVAWGYYARGKSILTIAKEQNYSQEHVRRRLRAAEKLLTGSDKDG